MVSHREQNEIVCFHPLLLRSMGRQLQAPADAVGRNAGTRAKRANSASANLRESSASAALSLFNREVCRAD